MTSTARRGPAGTEPASTSSPSGCSAIASSCAPGGPTTATPPLPKFSSRCPPGCSRATAKRRTPPTVTVPATRMRPSRNSATARAPPAVAPVKPMVRLPRWPKLRSSAPRAVKRPTRKPRPSLPTTVARPSPCSATAAPLRFAPARWSSAAAPPAKAGSRSPARAWAAAAGAARTRSTAVARTRSISASNARGAEPEVAVSAPASRRSRRRSQRPRWECGRPARPSPRAPRPSPPPCPWSRRRSRRRGPSSCRAAR